MITFMIIIIFNCSAAMRESTAKKYDVNLQFLSVKLESLAWSNDPFQISILFNVAAHMRLLFV